MRPRPSARWLGGAGPDQPSVVRFRRRRPVVAEPRCDGRISSYSGPRQSHSSRAAGRRFGLQPGRRAAPASRASTVQPGSGSTPGEADPDLEVQRAGPEVVGEPGDRPDVGEVDRSGRVQEHRAGDPAVPPLVLVLDVRRVRPLHDPQRQRVRARPDEVGEVELGGQVGVLAEPDVARR